MGAMGICGLRMSQWREFPDTKSKGWHAWGWSLTQHSRGSVTNTTQGAAQLRRGEAGVPSPAGTHPKVSGERGVTMGEPGGDSWVGDSPSSPLPLAALPMGAGACVRAPLAAPDRLSTGSRGV